MANCLQITIDDINRAHQIFLQNEPRDLFYRTAIYLIELSLNQNGNLTLAEAISVLLQTWNKSYYRFRKFDTNHFNQIEQLVQDNCAHVLNFRNRIISTLSQNDDVTISNIFNSFENILGPVGSAKALHLLAPSFFPIWDRPIAIAYNQALTNVGTNNNKYINFMHCQKEQCLNLPDELPDGISILKAIDEYNYCHFSKGWL